ncbi:MAG TPA: hypothetical protein VM901_07965 [Bdellovibrionota bacterium]|nr:hypothetical protein [Bdellovibrionota bacterium]
MSRRVPRGANGRGAAASVLRLGSKNELLEVGYEKNAHVFQAVASTQKIMTAWIVAKFASSQSTRVRFDQSDLFYDEQGTRAYNRSTSQNINVGDNVTLKLYLYTLMVQSSNGAAHALGRGTSRTVESFVAQMNAEAARMLGNSRRTYYQNPSGLTDDADVYRFASTNARQGSTAREMALLVGFMMNDASYRSKLSSAGVENVSSGYLYKPGATEAAGRTAVMRIPHLGRGCRGQSLAVALFGEDTNTQSANLRSAYEELKGLFR